MSDPFVTASHDVLFEEDGEAIVCDACGAVIAPAREDAASADDDATSVAGKGTYLVGRGGAFAKEDVPLCPECGVAIVHAAQTRWDIEDEEG
ncbi:MAG: hypothetical protein U0169_18475 [Polyangiaceae bacterium]